MIPPSRRIITICAYLRIVYALLVYTPDPNTGLVVANQIAGSLQYMKELTFICEWAGWREGNIAAKYLRIMNVVLELSPSCRKHQFIRGYLIISHALKAVLGILESKLKEDDKCPLTEEDKILVSETCECMGKIIQNSKFISFLH